MSGLIAKAPFRLRGSTRRVALSPQANVMRLRRQASTSPSPQEPVADDATFRTRTRTILHKAESFLPRVLPVSGDLPASATLPFWRELLDGACNTLYAVSNEAPARIVVYGCDEYSGARDLVTALLQEPYAPPSRNEAIAERWKGANEQHIFSISHGFTQSGGANSLRIPSIWLQQFNVPANIGELPTLGSSPTTITLALFSADIPIVVCNPVTTPLSTIFSNPTLPLSHANAILVITASPISTAEVADYISKRLPPTLKVLYLDPARALIATQTLSSNSASSSASERYQTDYTESKVPELTSVIAEKLSPFLSRDVCDLQATTARELTKMSLSACRGALERASREVDDAVLCVMGLKDYVAEFEERIGPEILGADGSSAVRDAIGKARREVQMVMDDLPWWRIASRVVGDIDVGVSVRVTVDRNWCRDLEGELIFHGGRLAAAQRSFTVSARQLVASYRAPSPFHSPVLENHLEQLQSSPSYAVRPSSLTTLIHTRRAQIWPSTHSLHSTAQRVTLGMGGSVLSGLGIAWAGWAEHAGIIGGALSTGMQPETAIIFGALVAALGMRLMVGSWDKARERWWQDWDRVADGLERELKSALDRVVSEQVTLIPREASLGLLKIAEDRKEEILALQEELTVLYGEAETV